MPTLSCGDVNLYFEDSGQGRPVLLLHGLGSSGSDWELITPALARSFRVIVPDVRGHGRSDKPAGDYGVPLFARDVAALCARLGIDKVDVVGLSMGGMIAFELAVTQPALVRSLTIVNSGPDMASRAVRVLLGLRLLLLRTLGPRRLAAMVAKKLFPKPEQAALRQRVQDALGKNDRDVYMRATRGLIGWTVLPRIREIACPVLVLASDGDYTPVSMKKVYVDLLKDARLEVIKDSGHAAPIDQPAQVIEKLTRFLQALASG